MAERHSPGSERRESEPGAQALGAAQLIAVLGLVALLGATPARDATPPTASSTELIFTQAPYRKKPAPVSGRFVFRRTKPDGARIVRLAPGGRPSVLTPEFASACDPALSFDAQRLLFAGKRRREDKWTIWEMAVDGTRKRQITADLGNCWEPRYLAPSSITPPDFEDKVPWIVFASDAAATREELSEAEASALYVRNIEPIASRGIVTWRTTYNLSSDFSPAVLGDGRVMFTSRQPGDAAHQRGRFPLMMTNWDGTVLSLFYGNSEGSLLNTMPAEMPDRTLVFVESDGETADGSGRLARVSFKRPLHSYEALSRGPGRYHSPVAAPDGSLLASYSPGTGSFGIVRFDFKSGTPAAVVYDDPAWDELEATPVAARLEPTGLLSAVVDSAATADLQCLSVYDSDTPPLLKKGEVKSVRFIEGVPAPIGRPSPPRTRVLGEAPVEEDGSFYVTVPSDTPFYVELMDAKGMALKTMRGWMWVRSGTSRGCVGCHENKEYAPENRATMALIKHSPTQLLPRATELKPGAAHGPTASGTR